MSSFKFFILFIAFLLCFSTLNAANTQSYSCATSETIQKVCDMAFFPRALNLTFTVGTAKTYDTLLSTTFPNFTGSQFSQNYLSPTMQQLAHLIQFDTLKIINPNVTINTGKTYAVRFSGVFSLFNIDTQLDALFIKNSPVSALFAASLPFSSLATILSKFFPMNISKVLDVMGGGSSLSLIVTNGFDFKPIPDLKPSYLIGVDAWVNSSLGLYANVRLTTGNNPVSKFLRKYLGDSAALQLAIGLNQTGFRGYIGIVDFQITKNLTLSKAGISIIIDSSNPDPTIGLVAQMKTLVNDYTLTFDGSLTFNPVSVGMSFSMTGIWINALGIDRLYFGNLLLSAAISYEGVPTEFAVGCEIAVGLECYNVQTFQGNGYCLRGQGYVGIDLTTPANNYFYLDVSALSLDIILRAFLGSKSNQTVAVPDILNNALQFPTGLTLAYSTKDKTLVNIKLRAGYLMNGTISVFGATATIQLQILTLAHKISAYVAASPINFGNVFTLNGDSPTSGPFLNITANLFPPVLDVNMAAKITVLGISASVAIVINTQRLYFSVSGPLLYGILIANFTVELLNQNWKGFNFGISGNIQMNQDMLALISFVSSQVSVGLKNAQTQIVNGQSSVTKAAADLEAKKAQVCADINSKCGSTVCVQSATKCDQYGTKSQCSAQENQCTGGWSDKCTSTTKKCTSSLPSWLGWACKGWSDVCTATEKVCGAYSMVCTATINVVDDTKCLAQHTYCAVSNFVIDNACKLACDASKAGLDVASASLTTANAAMQVTQQSFGGLAKAFDFISKNTVTVFNIKNVGFSFQMSASNKASLAGGFGVNIDCTILGKDYQRTVFFSFSDINAIRKAITDDVMSVAKGMFQ